MIRSYFECLIRRPLRGLRRFWFAFPQARLPSPGAITLSASFAGWLNDSRQQFNWLSYIGCCEPALITRTFGPLIVRGTVTLISGVLGKSIRGTRIFISGIEPSSTRGMTIVRTPCGVVAGNEPGSSFGVTV